MRAQFCRLTIRTAKTTTSTIISASDAIAIQTVTVTARSSESGVTSGVSIRAIAC